MTTTLRVDIWSDIACPWCYIGQARFAKGLDAFATANGVDRADVHVTWHSYQLDPTLPARFDGSEVDYLVQTKGMTRQQVEQMTGQVAAAAAGEGLPIDFDAVVPANSLRAHYLLKTIARHGGDVDKAEHALFAAHFAQGQVISDDEVLVRIGTECGISAEQARAGLDDDTIHAEVQGDFATARSIGVSGVPFFVLGEKYAVSGAQPPELFTQALERTWSELQPAKPQLINLDSAPGEACGPEGCD
ncbi:DsbA family oxidoreductase [Granulicoccus sp. GXG6511]|uniref:DsbA family oxidoreductase n=1 Tax=Granulicoccus sp. GXG6511 TaxID=3381351 RepID=UPI003D7C7B52